MSNTATASQKQTRRATSRFLSSADANRSKIASDVG
jgi:hypothetical protein